MVHPSGGLWVGVVASADLTSNTKFVVMTAKPSYCRRVAKSNYGPLPGSVCSASGTFRSNIFFCSADNLVHRHTVNAARLRAARSASAAVV